MTYYGSKDVGLVAMGSTGGANNWVAAFKQVMGGLRTKVTAVTDSRKFVGNAFPTVIDTGAREAELEFTDVVYEGTMNSMWSPGANQLMVITCPEGDTLGAHFYGFQSALVTAAEAQFAPDAVDVIVPEITVTGKVNLGTIVAPLATRTTAGNTDATWADLGTSYATGIAYIFTTGLALGAATSTTVKVRHSSDHITFVDHTAFTNITAIGNETKALSSLVNRYLSISWAYNGGAGSSWTGTVGVAVD